MFLTRKILALFFSLAMILSIAGVYATWRYTSGPPLAITTQTALSMVEFVYRPEEVVPGGDKPAEVGEDHMELLQLILHEASYGLNATKKPIIHTYLESVGDVVYCDQHTTGGNLKHLMVDGSENAERLYFLILKVSDTEYHTFTMLYSDIQKPLNTEIDVYRTVMEKDENGKWDAPRSYLGTARVNSPAGVSRAIDVSSWVQT